MSVPGSGEPAERSGWQEHLLVDSRGPWDGPGWASFLADAATLARTGRRTRVLLVQDGVLGALAGAPAPLGPVLEAGGELCVDRFSWAQRGLAGQRPRAGVRWSDLDETAGWVLDPGVQVVWR
ncbi:MAG: hypothetical protein ACJ73E_10150 [Mycobacteriales bacterium]